MENSYTRAADIFKVLSIDKRLKIIELLKRHGAIGTKFIAEKLEISTAAVSQHLKILKQAGLVTSERSGFWLPYTINEDALEQCRTILDKICTCGCTSRDTKKNHTCCSKNKPTEIHVSCHHK